MTDPIHYGGFFVSPYSQLKATDEVDSFGSFYFQLGAYYGQERKSPLLPGNWLWEVGYHYIGGNERNLGSHAHKLDFRIGHRFDLFNLPFLNSPLSLKPKIGLGYSSNWMNFGRGFPLEFEPSGNVQFQLPVSIRPLCFNSTTCLETGVAFFADRAVLGSSPYTNMGALAFLELAIGPDRKEKDVEGVHGNDSRPRVGAEQETGRPSTPSRANPTATSLTASKDQCTITTIAKQVTQDPVGTSFFMMPKPILFGNDNPDVPLQAQWFAADNGAMSPCFSTPELDHYIVTLQEMIVRAADRFKAGSSKITFEIHVKGYANDTGSPERNRILAKARSQSVIDYMEKEKPKSHLRDLYPPTPEGNAALKKRREAFRRAYGADIDVMMGRVSCGARDAYGENIGNFSSKNFKPYEGYIKFKNDNDENPNADPNKEIETDFQTSTETSNPAFRMVRIRIDLIENGKKLTPDQAKPYFDSFMMSLEGRKK